MANHKSESTVRQYTEGLGAFAGATTAIVAPALAVGIGAVVALIAAYVLARRKEKNLDSFVESKLRAVLRGE
ncbi:hypothetical protein J4419_02750 [Candidatus Woesearchaeota archaeon]|nr:hypothetical protein [Candidatus Woesearchaeota archaeon]